MQAVTTLRLAIIIMTLLIPIRGCGTDDQPPFKEPPPSAKDPPIYPGAQSITDKIEPPSGGPQPPRRITFETRDEPDKVLDYYRDILSKDGWEPGTWDDKPPNALWYLWTSGATYGFTVTVTTNSQDTTNVELYITSSWPE